jgi:WD40 repeat protein/predicted Ser/Thr protein kinase
VEQHAREFRSYALKHLPAHLCELGRLEEAVALVTGDAFLQAKLRAPGGAGEVREDLSFVGTACRRAGLEDLARQIDRRLEQFAPPADQASEAGRESALAFALAGQLALSPDGRRLACGTDDQAVRVWDLGTAAELLALFGLEDSVTCVAFSSAGDRIAAGAEDGTACVWDSRSGDSVGQLSGPPEALAALRFTSDGRQLITRAVSGTLRVWELEGCKELACLRGEELAPEVAVEAVLRVLRELRRAALDATTRIEKARLGHLLLQVGRSQVRGRLAEMETSAEPELVTAVLQEALAVLPDEPVLLVRLARLLARQQRWEELYPLFERARQLDLAAGLREELTTLERQELMDLRRTLPETISEEEWPSVRSRLRALECGFRNVPEYHALRCATVTAFVAGLVGTPEAARAPTARLRRLGREYGRARKRCLALAASESAEECTQTLRALDARMRKLVPELVDDLSLPERGALPTEPAEDSPAPPPVKSRSNGSSIISAGPEVSLATFLEWTRGLGRQSLIAALRGDQRKRWKHGQRVRAEDYLQRRPDLGLSIARALVTGEVGLRQQQGESIVAEEYRHRFPELVEPSVAQPPSNPPINSASLVPAPMVRIREAAPTQLNGLEVREELGRGGMGVVYKAWHATLNRFVAVKMLAYGACAGQAQLARFRLEAEAIARLHHPNIAQIYEFGEHQGQPYIVQEFVGGGRLDQHIVHHSRPVRWVAEMFVTLASAVHHMHERGILHRDLKPGNVLLAEDGTPKIIDFGLAKKLGEPSLTPTGAVIGTPSYMAPEQAHGRTHDVGFAIDIYALGAGLYECLTGRPPFRGETVMETLRLVLFEEPLPPSRLRPSIPRDLETICLKCLQKNPTNRYRSAQNLADDLKQFLAGKAVRARPVGRAERSWRWCRRNPVVATLVMLVTLLFVAGMAVSTLFASLAAKQAQMAQDQAEDRLNAETARLQAVQEARAMRLQAVQEARAMLQATVHDRALSARYFLEHGVRLCEDERTRPEGLLWLAHGLKAATDKTDLRLLLRMQLAAWGSRPEPVRKNVTLGEGRWQVLFSPDGRSLLAWSGREAQLVSLETGKPIAPAIRSAHSITAATLSPNRERLILGYETGGAGFWVLQTRKETLRLKNDSGIMRSLAFSPDGRLLVSGNADKTVKVWEALMGLLALTLKGHTSEVGSVAFSPDGKRIASGSDDKTVKVWDALTGQRTLTLKGHTGAVRSVCFSPDEKWVASGSSDGTARLWVLSTGTPAGPLFPHPGRVTKVAFSPDGRTLLVAGEGMVRLWDVGTALPLGLPLTQTGPVQDAAFTPDGTAVWIFRGERTLERWARPAPLRDEPRRVVLWAELLSGLRLEDGDTPVPLDDEARQAKKRELDELGGPP